MFALLAKAYVGAATVALLPATIVISFAVEYLVPDPFADEEVIAYLDRTGCSA